MPQRFAHRRLRDDGPGRRDGPGGGGASAVRRHRRHAAPFPRRPRHHHAGPPRHVCGAGGHHHGGGGIPPHRLPGLLVEVLPGGARRAGRRGRGGQVPAAAAGRRPGAAPPAGPVAMPLAVVALSPAGPVPRRGCPSWQPAAAGLVATRRGASAGGPAVAWDEEPARACQPAWRRAIRRGNPRDRMIGFQPWCPSMTASLTAGGPNWPPSASRPQNTPPAGRRARWSPPRRLFRGPPALRQAAGGGPAAVMRGSTILLRAAAIRSTGSCCRCRPPRTAAGTDWPGRGASDRPDTRRR